MSTQASKPGQRGGRSHTAPPPQANPRQHQEAQTPTRTRAVAQTPNPSHPQANTPTTSLSKYAPKRTQGTCPHQHVWAHQVRAREPAYLQRRPARTKRKRPTRARRTTHTTSAQTTRFAYGVRLRPQGRTAREKAAHNSPRQSAWVVVFVGVFADVCRLFWLVGFGGLGVFWGCLACFLVF